MPSCVCGRYGAARRGERQDGDDGDHFRAQIGWYIANAAESPLADRYHGEVVRTVRWLLDTPNEDLDQEEVEGLPVSAQRLFHTDKAVRGFAARQALASFTNYPDGRDSVEANLTFAAEILGLDPIEAQILRFLVAYRHNAVLEDFADSVFKRLRQPAATLAVLIGEEPLAVGQRLEASARLISMGIIDYASEMVRYGNLAGDDGVLQLTRLLARVMLQPFSSREEWRAAVCGEPKTAALEWEDFAHLGEMRDLALDLLAGAARERGVNILLHGPVGTGKTEFAKVLAARLGVPIWSAGEADEMGREPTRLKRLSALRLTQRLLGGEGRALVLLDEAQDLIEGELGFFGHHRLEGSRIYLHRVLERNEVPTLWTCNSLTAIDPAVLRRFSLAVEVRTPTARVCARIWKKAWTEAGLPVGDQEIDRLAQTYEAAPALIVNAVRVAKLSGRGVRAAEVALASSLEVFGQPAPDTGDARVFDPELVCCTEDLRALVAGLARPGAPQNWSLCLSGPPGTGKSLFARHLAWRLGLEVIQRRIGDLPPGRGGDIATAFAEARAGGALLLFDEAEILLCERSANDPGRQINELFAFMARHPLPVVCAASQIEPLDWTSLRRFTFKLRFEILTPRQTALAFERFFDLPAPAGLPAGLAAGDFVAVAKRRAIVGGNAGMLARWLEDEAEVNGARRRAIGFGAPVR